MTKNDIIERYPIDILEHAERVMDLVRPFGEDYMMVALLHDIMEDTDTSYMELSNLFSFDIVDDVFALTHHSCDTYFSYIERITRCGRKRPVIVKYYDILDHLYNKATLKPSLEKRYLKAKNILENALDI